MASWFRRSAPAAKAAEPVVKKGIEQLFGELTTKPAPVGRAWEASELRLKSFDDLHKLWFVLLKERDQLAAASVWAKRQNLSLAEIKSRLIKVKRSMARIKLVLSERSIAYKRAKAKLLEQAPKNAGQGVGLAAALDSSSRKA